MSFDHFFTSKLFRSLFVATSLLLAQWLTIFPAQGGCAVALEIQPHDSLFIHSESSLTPKGGHNFISAADAASALMAGLKGQHISDAQIIFQSDQTGYFSVAAGHTDAGKAVSYVACEPDSRKSDASALAGLKAKGAIDGGVLGRFHSYGDDSSLQLH